MKRSQGEKLSLIDQKRLLTLRKKGKRQGLSTEEQLFCEQAYQRDPETYREVEQQLVEWVAAAEHAEKQN